jgi:hypothetical protein
MPNRRLLDPQPRPLFPDSLVQRLAASVASFLSPSPRMRDQEAYMQGFNAGLRAERARRERQELNQMLRDAEEWANGCGKD